MKEALIDNTALSYFADLNSAMVHAGYRDFDIFGPIASLLRQLHVPLQVVAELDVIAHLPEHGAVLNRIQSDQAPFVACTRFDSLRKSFLSSMKGIDLGELEAIAQSEAIGVRLFITDDNSCVEAIKDSVPQIRCVSSLFILAAVDLNGFLLDRDIVFGKYLSLYRRGKAKAWHVRSAYEEAAKHYRINIDKKTLNRKSSIKHLPS